MGARGLLHSEGSHYVLLSCGFVDPHIINKTCLSPISFNSLSEMPSTNTPRQRKHSTDERLRICKETKCTRRRFKKTGRCHEHALKLGMALVRELLDTDAAADPNALLSLSAAIAMKVTSVDTNNDSIQQFAPIFHDIAFMIKTEPNNDKSFGGRGLWGMFWKTEPAVKVCKADENV